MLDTLPLRPADAAANPGANWGVYEVAADGDLKLVAACYSKAAAASYKRHLERQRKLTGCRMQVKDRQNGISINREAVYELFRGSTRYWATTYSDGSMYLQQSYAGRNGVIRSRRVDSASLVAEARAAIAAFDQSAA